MHLCRNNFNDKFTRFLNLCIVTYVLCEYLSIVVLYKSYGKESI